MAPAQGRSPGRKMIRESFDFKGCNSTGSIAMKIFII
jgi:hypothetical protein